MQTPEYRKKYYEKNKKSILEKNKKWAIENPNAMREMQKRFTQTPKGIYQCLKTNCHNKKRTFKLEQEDFLKWYDSQEKRCCYCKVEENNIPLSFQKISVSRNGIVKRLTIDRKDNAIGYVVSNLALCCAQCNRMKGEFLSYKEMLEVGKIIEKKWRDDCDVDLGTVNIKVRGFRAGKEVIDIDKIVKIERKSLLKELEGEVKKYQKNFAYGQEMQDKGCFFALDEVLSLIKKYEK